ncbi:AlpA family transcriptional regulator [Paracoccus sp. MKU1]|uniref:helix-turn-helix transcriptional regulator n=1 Tax=Paracoccus sp. MKU1 TaxID=1745182 RepID=UPI00071924C4|nr:hypothetical protein [Paracoccus sp. MKU1]KRW94271.1 hypothetical protein AQY21_20285 [Paracoccus sp. MKU1]
MSTDNKHPELPDLKNARDDPEWWAERNKRRRQRYAEDPEYRKKARLNSRSTYRVKGKTEPFDPRQNLSRIDDFGKVRPVTFPDGRVVERWCMTKAEVAEIFGRSTKLFYHWIKDGRFPDTVLTATDTFITRDYKNKKGVKVPQTVGVYSSEEVIAAINALGPHLSNVVYFRTDHDREREMVAMAVAEARASIGVKLGE